MKKLWHDDIRRPPDDTWAWARTNEDAKLVLQSGRVEVASLDHDMGLHEHNPDVEDADLRIGADAEDGYELVRWMCATGNIPPRVFIHSWNPPGAERMRALLADHGCTAVVAAYSRPNWIA